MFGTASLAKLFSTSSSSVQRSLVKVALFGGAAALCAYAGYRAYNRYALKLEEEEEEDVYVLAPESVNDGGDATGDDDSDGDDDDDDDDDDDYETASEGYGDEEDDV